LVALSKAFIAASKRVFAASNVFVVGRKGVVAPH